MQNQPPPNQFNPGNQQYGMHPQQQGPGQQQQQQQQRM